MDFFGLIWVASFLSHSASTLFATPNVSSTDTYQFSTLGNPVADDEPNGFSDLTVLMPLYPQMLPLNANLVDWEDWATVATVVVVPVQAETPTSADAIASPYACNLSVEPEASATPASTDQTPQQRFQIWVHDKLIGEVSRAETAQRIARRLRRFFQTDNWQPDRLQPLITKSSAAGGFKDEVLFVVNNDMVGQLSDPALIAVEWTNNLRLALGADPLEFADVQMVANGLTETSQRITGIASWYGPYFHGRQTATGEIFNQHELTAAHPSLPFGTYLKVRNLLNQKAVVVRVNDRGPYIGERSLDLSYAAAQCLGSEDVGVIPYEATILQEGTLAKWQPSLVANAKSQP